MNETSTTKIPVALIIVGYGGEAFILECLDSVFESRDPNVDLRVLLVDNHSPDQMCKRVAGNFAAQMESGQLKIVHSEKNLGFAGGNNFGWAAARELWPDARYLVLLNQDTVVMSGWLWTMIDYLERHANVAAAQPKIMLHEEPKKLNTAGNVSHFLGFGFCRGDRELDSGQYDGCEEVHYCSGAAVVLRVEALNKVGLFDDAFFLYLEDAELGWKLKQIGYMNIVITAAKILHKHQYSTNKAYYFLEKNRLWLVAVYYKWQTLVLLWPAFMLMEVGQFFYAATKGLFTEKVRAWDDFLRSENLKRMWRTRKEAQARRTISDAAFMGGFRGTVESPAVQSWALKYVGNPILGLYWAVARVLIFW